MAKPTSIGLGSAVMALALGMAAPGWAQGLDPRVATPLMQLIQGAGMQCQAGNPQACAMVSQLQQAGNELTQAQFACQQGNPQACQMFQMGAQQVMAAHQQNFGGLAQTPIQRPPSPQQQSWDHQQRMQQQQRANDLQHQRFMEQLRR